MANPLRERERASAPRSSTGPPEISPEEITRIRVLGDGSFGTVYEGRCRNKEVAVKVLHKQTLDERSLAAFRREVEIMSKIFHPNIVLFMGACTVPGHMCIVTELLPKGDLETMLKNPQIQLSLLQKMRMTRDAALGMTWLHGGNPVVLHRDLKAANILVDANMNVKMCDFGLSQIKRRGEALRDGQGGAKGTPLWMAPEVMLGQPFDEKADIYSFGIVIWEIVTRLEPFAEFDNFAAFRAAVCTQHLRPPIPADTPASLRSLIEKCWNPDTSVRPTFPQICEAVEDIILEVSIADDYGRKLWTDCFKRRETVKWSDFRMAFDELLGWSVKNFAQPPPGSLPDPCPPELLTVASGPQLEEWAQRSQAHYGIVAQEFARRQAIGQPLEGSSAADPRMTEINYACLKAVLIPEGDLEETVTMENFGRVLSWFGPLVVPGQGVVLLDKIRSLLQKKFFHGDITTREAETRLQGKGLGTFLIRFSTSAPGSYTISKISRDGTISHQRVLYQPGVGFVLNDTKAYPSLDLLVNTEMEEMSLINTCSGSKYTSIFQTPESSGYVQSTGFTPQPAAP